MFCEEPLSVFVTVIVPLPVIGLPEILNPPPLLKATLDTVPVQVVNPVSLLKPDKFICDFVSLCCPLEASTTAKKQPSPLSIDVDNSFKQTARDIDPLPVIGLPVATNPSLALMPTLVTVPVQVVFALNVLQSVDVKTPLEDALESGMFSVIFPLVVIGLPETLTSVPVVPVSKPTLVTVPPASVTVKVTVSVVSSVVIAIPEPTKVKVSLLVSATIVFSPETAKFLYISV